MYSCNEEKENELQEMETMESIDYLPPVKEQGTLPTFANKIALEIRLLYASVK